MLAALAALFLCRAVLGAVIVPPWQGPDEPDHFVHAYVQHLGASLASARPAVEADVLASMARHRWWEPYDVPTPDPVPVAFVEVGGLGRGTYTQPVYYGLGAALFDLTRPSSVEQAYWHLRLLSIAAGIVTLVLGWLGTRLLFGPAVAAGATAIAVLNPQFLLFALTVNPDAIAAVLGAFIWWQVACVVRGRRPGLSLALIVIAVAALPITKRSAVPMGAVALAVVVVAILGLRLVQFTRATTVALVAAVAAVAAAAVAAVPVFEGAAREFVKLWGDLLIVRRPLGGTIPSQLVHHVNVSIDSVWLIAGWLRFEAPEVWLWIARALTLAGFLGAAVVLVRARGLRLPLSIASAFVIVQAVAVMAWAFVVITAPQGRYQFPVIAPATALLWLGLTHGAPPRLQPYAAPLLLGVLAMLDVTAFTAVLMPAYLPWT